MDKWQVSMPTQSMALCR